jgi:hypothetical protein
MNFIFTALNEKYYKLYAIPWIFSLRQIANFQGQVIIIDFGLSESSKNELSKFNVVFIGGDQQIKKHFRFHALKIIAMFAEYNQGKIAWWDIDAYFQDNIDSLFEKDNDKFYVTKNLDFGFLYGSSNCWKSVSFVDNVISFFDEPTDKSFHEYFLNFSDKVELIANEWNFIDIFSLEDIDGKLFYKKIAPKVVHPSGYLKTFWDQHKFSLFEKHKEIFNQTKCRPSIKKRAIFTKPQH